MPGDVLFEQGDDGSYAYLVLNGSLGLFDQAKPRESMKARESRVLFLSEAEVAEARRRARRKLLTDEYMNKGSVFMKGEQPGEKPESSDSESDVKDDDDAFSSSSSSKNSPDDDAARPVADLWDVIRRDTRKSQASDTRESLAADTRKSRRAAGRPSGAAN